MANIDVEMYNYLFSSNFHIKKMDECSSKENLKRLFDVKLNVNFATKAFFIVFYTDLYLLLSRNLNQNIFFLLYIVNPRNIISVLQK